MIVPFNEYFNPDLYTGPSYLNFIFCSVSIIDLVLVNSFNSLSFAIFIAKYSLSLSLLYISMILPSFLYISFSVFISYTVVSFNISIISLNSMFSAYLVFFL